MMVNKFLIVGLRSIDPIPVGFGSDCLPGYFCQVLSTHRNGFQLPGIDGWFAFLTNPFSAMEFDSGPETIPFLELLCESDPGRWRPLTVISTFR